MDNLITKELPGGGKRLVSAIISLAASALFTGVCLYLISQFYNPPPPAENTNNLILINGYIAPEPLERLLFVCGILIFPVTLFSMLFLSKKYLNDVKDVTSANLYKFLSTASLVAIFALIWSDLKKDDYFLFYTVAGANGQVFNCDNTGCTIKSLGIAGLSPIIILAAAGLTYALYKILTKRGGAAKATDFILHVLSLFFVLIAFLLSIFGINRITYEGAYKYSFNAVFHSMVQVYHGKELLYDLTNQYGLYPVFLEPIFRVIGLGVIRFTVVMGLLTALAVFLVYRFLKEEVSEGIIASLGFITAMFYCNMYWRFITPEKPDPYFQYYPIRLLVPALTIYLAHRFLKSGDKRLYLGLFILTSFGVLWNLDTGFVAFASWMLLLLFTELYTNNFKGMARHLLTGGSIFALALLLFSSYMLIRYGHIPEYAKFFKYQKIFLSLGFLMLPMKLLHPWNIILLVYAIGLTYSFCSVVYQRESLRAKMIFFLSILGVGLFAYYQGRSHDQNLGVVSYPAFLLLALFADSLFRRVKGTGDIQGATAFAGIAFVMALSSASLIYHLPDLAEIIRNQVEPVINNKPTIVTSNADFVRSNTTRGEGVVILSQLSGVYYLESDTSCPAKIPGGTEMLLEEDYNTLVRWLKGAGPGNKIFVDFSFPTLYEYLDQNYYVVNGSPDGSMLIMVKK